MQTIGMIGGMSWESTAVYYRIANELVRDRVGGLNSAKIMLASLNFAEINQLQKQAEWERAGKLLAETACGLEAAGADMVLICTNTMHLLYDAVQTAVSIPVIHIGDVTARAITAQGLRTVGLLGTAFTMEKDFYRDRISSHGLEVLIPRANDRRIVHRAIFEELALGLISESTRSEFLSIIDRLIAEGAEGIVLGCTEIELLISENDCPVPIFPTARLHAEAAVDAALAAGVSPRA